jgi:hypothetical protein
MYIYPFINIDNVDQFEILPDYFTYYIVYIVMCLSYRCGSNPPLNIPFTFAELEALVITPGCTKII